MRVKVRVRVRVRVVRVRVRVRVRPRPRVSVRVRVSVRLRVRLRVRVRVRVWVESPRGGGGCPGWPCSKARAWLSKEKALAAGSSEGWRTRAGCSHAIVPPSSRGGVPVFSRASGSPSLSRVSASPVEGASTSSDAPSRTYLRRHAAGSRPWGEAARGGGARAGVPARGAALAPDVHAPTQEGAGGEDHGACAQHPGA